MPKVSEFIKQLEIICMENPDAHIACGYWTTDDIKQELATFIDCYPSDSDIAKYKFTQNDYDSIIEIFFNSSSSLDNYNLYECILEYCQSIGLKV